MLTIPCHFDMIISDLFELLKIFMNHTDVTSMSSYKLMERVLKEKRIITETVNGSDDNCETGKKDRTNIRLRVI